MQNPHLGHLARLRWLGGGCGGTRRGVGSAVGARGELHYKVVRHAGDAPLGGLV